MARFFLEAAAWAERPALTGEEATHCARVLRAKPGDQVDVFDGCGRGALAEVIEVGRERVCLKLGEVVIEERPAVEVVLAQSVLKGKAMELLLQKAVELGAAVIQPLETERSVVKPGEGKVEKWRRVVLEACKQCGRNRLPEVREVGKLENFVEIETDGVRLIASLGEGARPMRESLVGTPERIVFLVGPEGDFTEEEVGMATKSGFQPVRLGKAVLRSETAAMYGLAAISCACS